MIIETTEYRGSPVLSIKNNEDEKYPFSFGVKKAKMILESIDEIKKFVEENDNKDKT